MPFTQKCPVKESTPPLVNSQKCFVSNFGFEGRWQVSSSHYISLFVLDVGWASVTPNIWINIFKVSLNQWSKCLFSKRPKNQRAGRFTLFPASHPRLLNNPVTALTPLLHRTWLIGFYENKEIWTHSLIIGWELHWAMSALIWLILLSKI